MNNLVFPSLSNIFQPTLFVVAAVFLFVLLYFVFRKKSRNNAPDKFEELYQKLKEEIKSAVTPKFMNVSVEASEITDLAVEIWRIEQRVAKSASSLPENHLKGLENSIQKLKRYLEKYDIEIVDYKNQKYNDGLNLEILGVEKDPSISEPIIKEVKEPTIMLKGQVVRKAKIILLSNQ